MKFFVKTFTSKKSGKRMCALCCDLGYTIKYISFDSQLCAELACLPVYELMIDPVDRVYNLAEGGVINE